MLMQCLLKTVCIFMLLINIYSSQAYNNILRQNCNSAIIYSRILAILVSVAKNYIRSQNFSITMGLPSPGA